MQIGIYGSGTTETAAKTIKKILDESGIQSFTVTKSRNKQADCIIVLGGVSRAALLTETHRQD